MRTVAGWLVLVLVLVVAVSARARGDEASEGVRTPPPFDTFLVLPLRVHVLTAEGLPDVDCKLRDEDVTRVVGKVNTIWNRAGLHWALESIVREPAARPERFRLARELDRSRNLGLYRLLVPEGSATRDALHVYYIHRFAVNGVWLGGRVAFVQETARLREVEGGIDEPLPRVTAHELGHALGLSHRQARTNLLASGTTGTLLNAHEVETVRASAQRMNGVRTVEELRAEAERATAAGEVERARRLWGWLAEIPGAGDGPRKALDAIREQAGDRPAATGARADPSRLRRGL